MKDRWPLDATDEGCSLRLFKDALMGHAATAVVLSDEDEEDRRRTAEVEDVYARVRECSPEVAILPRKREYLGFVATMHRYESSSASRRFDPQAR